MTVKNSIAFSSHAARVAGYRYLGSKSPEGPNRLTSVVDADRTGLIETLPRIAQRMQRHLCASSPQARGSSSE